MNMNIIISVTTLAIAIILFIVIRRIEKELVLLNVSVPTAKNRIALAIDRPGKDASTDFIPVSLWGTQAENACKYLSKGRQIVVEGRIQTGIRYDENGKAGYTIGIVANNA